MFVINPLQRSGISLQVFIPGNLDVFVIESVSELFINRGFTVFDIYEPYAECEFIIKLDL